MSAVQRQRFPSPDLPKGVMGTFGTPEPGPMPIAGERDACGVGFIADTKGRNNHDIVARALYALGCMEHRGGCGGDRVSGDGAGVMTAVPWKLFEADGSLGGKPSESMGVAMAFLPRDEAGAKQAQGVLEKQAVAKGFDIVGWRDVPTRQHVLGPMALAALPIIRQAFLHHPTLRGDDLENALYKLRRSVQGDLLEMSGPVSETYFASLSSRTIIYKGMVQSEVLRAFYDDLTNELYTSNFAIYHRRFSTNTVPKWPLAQPMRALAHNGEINTLIGNVNWQRALDVQRGRRDPLCSMFKSDSANLDSVFENLIRVGGKTPALCLTMLVPEAYHEQPAYDNHPEIVSMLDYYAGLQEPWDGPALLTFCDGKQLGASLDRNGLRPARFLETKDGLVALMSETGVVQVDEKDVIRKGRLGPGNMITIDLETGVFRTNLDVKKEMASQAPYSEWLGKHASKIPAMPDFSVEAAAKVPDNIVQQMTAFGWSSEDLEMQVRGVIQEGGGDRGGEGAARDDIGGGGRRWGLARGLGEQVGGMSGILCLKTSPP
jgi:glutamate synthase (ferredoxin)